VKPRFTIDGGEPLEQRLEATCRRVAEGVGRILPGRKLRALVLGGGYGRGEGGVLREGDREHPYNDLEFYVLARGNRLLNERRYGRALRNLGEDLSPAAGLHVEFKIDAVGRLERERISMFSYDLVAGHKVVRGERDVFRDCGHHLEAQRIPLQEATRLLFNRCTGLLLARERLDRRSLTEEDADFIARNTAKAALALGDAVLTAHGQYHWSCRERHRRLLALAPETRQVGTAVSRPAPTPALENPPPWLERVQAHHARGVEFKLHPDKSARGAKALEMEHREVSELSLQIWLWVEGLRLGRRFTSPREYALARGLSPAGETGWRNFLLSLRSFGWRAAWDPLAWRYPRERLFSALPLLLWESGCLGEPAIAGHLRKQLLTDASGREELVSAYKQLWPTYG
jgi:hypothetical protein